ncbi:MAG: hypothetical protein R3F48_17000 [Candidatus Zixiibacteriota bacterium]
MNTVNSRFVFLIAFLLLLPAVVWAEDNSGDDNSEKDTTSAAALVEATDLTAPSSPAFILLDVSPKSIPESGMDIKDLKLDVIIKDDKIVSNAAIEVQPLHSLLYHGRYETLLRKQKQNYLDGLNGLAPTYSISKKRGYDINRVFQSMKLSLGTAEKDSTKFLAVGSRVNLFQEYDLIYDQKIIELISPVMSQEETQIGNTISANEVLIGCDACYPLKIKEIIPVLEGQTDSLRLQFGDVVTKYRYWAEDQSPQPIDYKNLPVYINVSQQLRESDSLLNYFVTLGGLKRAYTDVETKDINAHFKKLAVPELQKQNETLQTKLDNKLKAENKKRDRLLKKVADSLADAHWNAFTVDAAYGYMWSYDSPHVDSLKLKQEGFAYWLTSSFGPHKKVKANVMYKHSLMSGVKLDEYGASVMIGSRKQSFFFEYLFSPTEEKKYHTLAYGGNIKMSKTIAVELGLRTQYEKGLTRLTDFIPAINFRWNGKSIPVLK